MSGSKTFFHTPYVPHDPEVAIYGIDFWGQALPLEYSGWKDEVLSWKETCYLHGGLNPTDICRVTGPDATTMFNRICVNNIERLQVGASTHAVMCTEKGNILAHGLLVRSDENDYMTYWLDPVTSYHAASGEFDVVAENLTGKRFLFQIGGPRSLEVLETAFGEDLHDIRFLRHRKAEIGSAAIGVSGSALSVIRIGMAGTLGYEVHGDIEDAHTVYAAILEAGERFGIRRLGALSYLPLNHTENGFPQGTGHFQLAFPEDEGIAQYLRNKGWMVNSTEGQHNVPNLHLAGSMGDDLTKRYCNPVELGWGHLVKLDHDFIGRDALEEIKRNPTHQMVTLVWNHEDILDVYRSHFEPGEEYRLMEFPVDNRLVRAGRTAYNDKVMKDGEFVGMSMGRMYSYYYRKMISICPIAVDRAEPGTDVTVLWGEPGTRQKEIRATVAAFPFLDLPRNEEIDVETIPRLATAAPGEV